MFYTSNQIQKLLFKEYGIPVKKQNAYIEDGFIEEYIHDKKISPLETLFEGEWKIIYNDFYIEFYTSKLLKNPSFIDILYHFEIGMIETNDFHHVYPEKLHVNDIKKTITIIAGS